MKETIVFAATLLETFAVSFVYWSDMMLQEDIEKEEEEDLPIIQPIKNKKNSSVVVLPSTKETLAELTNMPSNKPSILNPA